MSENMESSVFAKKYISPSKEVIIQEDKRLTQWEYQNLAGVDTISNTMKTYSQSNLTGVFKEHFAEKPLSKDQIKQDIDKNYADTFKGRSVWFFTKGKRAEHAMNRINIQRQMQSEQQIYIKRRADEEDFNKAHLSKTYVKGMQDEFKTDEEKEALREWITGKTSLSKKFESLHAYAFQNEEFRDNEYKDILAIVNQIELDQFAYRSDREFASNFAKKYDLLCKGASAGVFLEKLEKAIDSGSAASTMSLMELKAKIGMFKDLKKEYEMRMKLMNSPYYALLTAKDLSRYKKGAEGIARLSGETKQGDFVQYMALYHDLQESEVGKGADIHAVYSKRLKTIMKDTKLKDIARYKNNFGNYELDDNKSGDELLRTMIDQETEHMKTSLPEDDLELLEDHQISMQNLKYKGLDTNSVALIEKMMLTIMREGTIDNVKIKDDDLNDIKSMITDAITIRRQFEPYNKLMPPINAIRNNVLGFDMGNDEFKDTKQFKVLEKIQNAQSYDKLYEEADKIKRQYIDAIVDLFGTISDKGYTITKKYADHYLEDKEEMLTEKIRNEYEIFYYKEHPLKKDEEKKRIDLPTFTLNDETFCTYAFENLAEVLQGKDIKIEGEEGKEILRLTRSYMGGIKMCNLLKKGFHGEDGLKSLLFYIHFPRVQEKTKQDEKKLAALLKGKVEGVEKFI